MQVTFLAHSGFLVETDEALLLFDWWKGVLPPLPDKPLVVFSSHSHQDHFKPEIFSLDDGSRTVRFVLGNDIKLSRRHKEVWKLSEDTVAKCQRLCGGKSYAPVEGVQVETLSSTDAGVAFVVMVGGKTIYHAGDLNWWYWSGESAQWNHEMEHNYKRYLQPIHGRHIDLAMVPLDSRLESGEELGLLHFLEVTDTERVLPMHQWEDYSATDRFMKAHPEWAAHILPIRAAGQQFTL